MPVGLTSTGPATKDLEEPLGTSLTRGVLVTLAVGSALGISPGVQEARDDAGTHVGRYTDVGALANSTSLQRFEFDGYFAPFADPTTMGQIRAMAPLSLRSWGAVFGVSHTAIGGWLKEEPPADRDKLATVLAALEYAQRSKPDLERWLTRSVHGLDVRPVDLLREGRWRAFRGAVAAAVAPTSTLSRIELEARRRAETSWAVAEIQIEPDEV